MLPVKEQKADLGIALDGDADRLVMVDNKGNIIDGDKLLAIIAKYRVLNNNLPNHQVVSTIMANSGLEVYLNSLGVELIRTQVGDRYVFAKMQECGSILGGEPSGHIIISDYIPTADGIVAALQVLSIMVMQEKTIQELASCYEPFPQIVRNIKYIKDPSSDNKISECIKNHTKRLQDNNSRLIVRKSGTEPIIRLMAEGSDSNIINESINDIVENIKHGGFLAEN